MWRLKQSRAAWRLTVLHPASQAHQSMTRKQIIIISSSSSSRTAWLTLQTTLHTWYLSLSLKISQRLPTRSTLHHANSLSTIAPCLLTNFPLVLVYFMATMCVHGRALYFARVLSYFERPPWISLNNTPPNFAACSKVRQIWRRMSKIWEFLP